MHAYNGVLTILGLAFLYFVFCVSVKVKLTVPLLCVCVHSTWKGRPRNDLYCVGWDVKPYSLTHSVCLRVCASVCFRPCLWSAGVESCLLDLWSSQFIASSLLSVRSVISLKVFTWLNISTQSQVICRYSLLPLPRR